MKGDAKLDLGVVGKVASLNLALDYTFIFMFSFPSNSSQLGHSYTNEIEHNMHSQI